MVKVPKKFTEETKALIRLSLFLRNEVGFRERLSAKELKQLLQALKTKKKA